MKNGKLRVALVGVSFGAEFIPIYLKHPDVDSLVLVDTNEKLLNTVGDKFLLEERLTDFNAMLEDKTIDAVHLVTPPATHAPLSIQVMAGLLVGLSSADASYPCGSALSDVAR